MNENVKKPRGPRRTFADKLADVDARLATAQERVRELGLERGKLVNDERERVEAARVALEAATKA